MVTGHLKFSFQCLHFIAKTAQKKKRLTNIKIYYDKIWPKKSNEYKIIWGKEQHKISNLFMI